MGARARRRATSGATLALRTLERIRDQYGPGFALRKLDALRALGVRFFLQKPFRLEDLLDTVERALATREKRGP